MKRLLLCAAALAASTSYAGASLCDPAVEFCPPDPIEGPGAVFDDDDGTINVFTPKSADRPHVVILPPNPIYPTDPILPPNPVVVRPGVQR